MHIAPTKCYLSLKYRVIYGRWIDWRNPQSFTEKLQWLKVYGYRSEYTEMVDKVLVKDYVKDKIGVEYIIPTYAVADSLEGIKIESLPDRFVLKTNHDSGTTIVCTDKTVFNFEEAKAKLNKALRNNYYLMGREKPYKYVKRKVLAESFLEHSGDLLDYKFFCFNGEPKFFKIDFGRNYRHQSIYFDMNREKLPFYKISEKSDNTDYFLEPKHFARMVEIASLLSKNIPFVRVDLYNIEGRIFFGEITFYPSSGFEPLSDPEWDLRLGSWINLPNKEKDA